MTNVAAYHEWIERQQRIAAVARAHLRGEIIGMMLTQHIEYELTRKSEDHYTVLVRQPRDGVPHWCVHKIGVHSDGEVGVVGSGSYCMTDEAGARRIFGERIGYLDDPQYEFSVILDGNGHFIGLVEDEAEAEEFARKSGNVIEMATLMTPAELTEYDDEEEDDGE